MKAFDKVLQVIQNQPQNGHAVANQKNKISLLIASLEIKEMMSLKCGN